MERATKILALIHKKMNRYTASVMPSTENTVRHVLSEQLQSQPVIRRFQVFTGIRFLLVKPGAHQLHHHLSHCPWDLRYGYP